MTDILTRFRSKFEMPDGTDGCWLWKGALTHNGYGRFSLCGTEMRAHRFAYIYFVGPIHESLVTDHLCRNRVCVNPRHLEPVPQAVNVARGGRGKKPHCANGHPFNETNTYQTEIQRHCRICQRAAQRRYRQRKSQVTPAELAMVVAPA